MLRRILFTLMLAAVCGLGLGAGSAAADGSLVATPDGRVMSPASAAALGLPTVPVPPPLKIPNYALTDSAVTPVADPTRPAGNNRETFWGYEANVAASKLRTYTGVTGGTTAGPSCVPTLVNGGGATGNGRGVAFDPLTGDLWISRLNGGDPDFTGDGMIHLVVPPNVDPFCHEVKTLIVHAKPGQTIQDDFGALDVDEATKHIWAAGYRPVNGLSYMYLINRNNGLVLQSCAIPFRDGGIGNDTLFVYRNSNLPGSGKYVVTDAGQLETDPHTFAVIDQSDCHNGKLVTPVEEVPIATIPGVSGADFESPGLVNTNELAFFNNGDHPWATAAPIGTTSGSDIEDISLCGFRAEFGGGGGNDLCPYP